MRIIPRPQNPVPQKWMNFHGVRTININELAQILPGYPPLGEVQLTVPAIMIPGHMTMIELAVLVSIVRYTGATSFAQIGTFDGITVRNLLDNCPDLQSIVTVDLPNDQHLAKGSGTVYSTDMFNASIMNYVDIGFRFRNHPRVGIVRDIRKDSAKLTPEDFPVKPEIFFIDGSHTYDYCASDTRIAHQVLAKPGILLWHDFDKINDLPGVTRALTELADDPYYTLYWLTDFPETSLVIGIQNNPPG